MSFRWTHPPLFPGAQVEFFHFLGLAIEHRLAPLRTAIRYQLIRPVWMRNGEGCVFCFRVREVNFTASGFTGQKENVNIYNKFLDLSLRYTSALDV